MDSVQPVLAVLARVLAGFSLAFLVPAAWALAVDKPLQVQIWLGALVLTLAASGALWYTTRGAARELMPKDGFLLVTLVWLVLPAFSAAPLMLTVPGIRWTTAYFEAMSALTATGATALIGLDLLPVSVNIWRCFLQYVGGLGIILLVVAVLPMLGLGGMQLFRAETPGPMKDAKLTPRIAETARGLWTVYFVLSGACLLAYRWAGMTWPDAFMHMCTTMGLGGFSSHDASFGYWNNPAIEGVAMVFMTLAGISFSRYFIVWRNRSIMSLLRSTEVQAYVAVLLASVAVIAVLLIVRGTYPGYVTAIRAAAFHVISLATTTGYASADYTEWPAFAPVC